MPDLRLRHRARMRAKDVKRLNDKLQGDLGLAEPPLPDATERAEARQDMDVLIADGQVLALILKRDGNEEVFPSIRGLLLWQPEKNQVTVDMGAIRFVTNGADVMAPGIVDADPSVQPGDVVWIRDERNKKPLGVGEALVTGPEMVSGGKGKAVRSLHHVGDDLWNLEL